MTEIIYRNLTELKELPNNPRKITKEALETLKKSIKHNPDYFEARPIILSDRTGELVIIAGNQRYKAAKELGLDQVPTVTLKHLTEEREREIIIRDNVSNGDWDWETLANKWDTDKLDEWGCDVKNWANLSDFSDTIERSSQGSVRDYSEDTNYDLKKIVRRRINPEIVSTLEHDVETGKIRPEIAEIMRIRVNQCVVFNFDEIIKFYRSEDATEEERDLLQQLYLVFITAKEAFERHMLELNTITGDIVDRKLMEQKTDEAD